MMLARVLFCAIAVLTIGAISPPAPISGESKPAEEFVQAKKITPAQKAVFRRRLVETKAAHRRLSSAITVTARIRATHGGHRNRAMHDMRLARAQLHLLEKHLKALIK